METILHYSKGSSDKIYQAAVIEEKGKWLYVCRYGRHKSKLKEETKEFGSKIQAEKCFDKKIYEKRSKGYENYKGSYTYSPIKKSVPVKKVEPALILPEVFLPKESGTTHALDF